MSGIKTGDRIRCTGASGDSFVTEALSDEHLNVGQTLHRQQPYMVVSIFHEGLGHPINWPLDSVEVVEVSGG